MIYFKVAYKIREIYLIHFDVGNLCFDFKNYKSHNYMNSAR